MSYKCITDLQKHIFQAHVEMQQLKCDVCEIDFPLNDVQNHFREKHAVKWVRESLQQLSNTVFSLEEVFKVNFIDVFKILVDLKSQKLGTETCKYNEKEREERPTNVQGVTDKNDAGAKILKNTQTVENCKVTPMEDPQRGAQASAQGEQDPQGPSVQERGAEVVTLRDMSRDPQYPPEHNQIEDNRSDNSCKHCKVTFLSLEQLREHVTYHHSSHPLG